MYGWALGTGLIAWHSAGFAAVTEAHVVPESLVAEKGFIANKKLNDCATENAFQILIGEFHDTSNFAGEKRGS